MTFASPSMYYLFYANWYCEDQRFCIIIETPETIKRDNDREYLIYHRRPGEVMCRLGWGGGGGVKREETNQAKAKTVLTVLQSGFKQH
jgi:hypothetical protein